MAEVVQCEETFAIRVPGKGWVIAQLLTDRIDRLVIYDTVHPREPTGATVSAAELLNHHALTVPVWPTSLEDVDWVRLGPTDVPISVAGIPRLRARRGPTEPWQIVDYADDGARRVSPDQFGVAETLERESGEMPFWVSARVSAMSLGWPHGPSDLINPDRLFAALGMPVAIGGTDLFEETDAADWLSSAVKRPSVQKVASGLRAWQELIPGDVDVPEQVEVAALAVYAARLVAALMGDNSFLTESDAQRLCSAPRSFEPADIEELRLMAVQAIDEILAFDAEWLRRESGTRRDLTALVETLRRRGAAER